MSQQFGPLLYTISVWALPAIINYIPRGGIRLARVRIDRMLMREKTRSTRSGPFGAGNPGRPKGSRNRASALLDAIADGELQAIVEKVVAKAKDGDLAAPRSRGTADAVGRQAV
jgi:hypothetical protein